MQARCPGKVTAPAPDVRTIGEQVRLDLDATGQCGQAEGFLLAHGSAASPASAASRGQYCASGLSRFAPVGVHTTSRVRGADGADMIPRLAVQGNCPIEPCHRLRQVPLALRQYSARAAPQLCDRDVWTKCGRPQPEPTRGGGCQGNRALALSPGSGDNARSVLRLVIDVESRAGAYVSWRLVRHRRARDLEELHHPSTRRLPVLSTVHVYL